MQQHDTQIVVLNFINNMVQKFFNTETIKILLIGNGIDKIEEYYKHNKKVNITALEQNSLKSKILEYRNIDIIVLYFLKWESRENIAHYLANVRKIITETSKVIIIENYFNINGKKSDLLSELYNNYLFTQRNIPNNKIQLSYEYKLMLFTPHID